MSKLFIEETTLTAIGDAIREKTGLEDLIAPGNMPDEIRSIETGGADPIIEAIEITANGVYSADDVDGYNPITVNVPQDGAPTDAELLITGNCQYKFANNGWKWVIDKYGNRITTQGITNAKQMFYYSDELTNIPFDINFYSNLGAGLTSMFDQCTKLKELPKINNVKPSEYEYLFLCCYCIRYIPDDYFDTWDFSYIDNPSSSFSFNQSVFKNCFSLRKIPMEILRHGCPKIYAGNYTVFEATFYGDYSLDEIIGMPNPYYDKEFNTSGYGGLFNQFIENCYRLKNFTFAEMDATKWANQTLDLSKSVGWGTLTSYILDHNSGITADKEVKDAATYEALKNDPDWFSKDKAYSRYNHDSAVATINSLPDCSTYQASGGGSANIIKFKGEAGSATDGGAINTLTDEEIAVAAAKGWTVSFA